MAIDLNEMEKTLHAKLDSGMDQLKKAKVQVEDFYKETEANIQDKLASAEKTLDAKKQDAVAAKDRLEDYVSAKTSETKAAVAEWKATHDQKKLEKHAERAEKNAEDCIEIAMCAAAEAQVAILEAVAARKDAEDAA
jgi:hypothetical protein